MADLTRQEIEDALELARYYVQKPSGAKSNAGMLARALLALTEQQPEPVDEGELATFLYDTALANLLDIDGDTPSVLAVELRRRYTITRKPQEADRG